MAGPGQPAAAAPAPVTGSRCAEAARSTPATSAELAGPTTAARQLGRQAEHLVVAVVAGYPVAGEHVRGPTTSASAATARRDPV